MIELTPQQRVMNMLEGRAVDRVPFTCYENKVSWGRAERELRNDGLCIVMRQPKLYLTRAPHCQTTSSQQQNGHGALQWTRIETPRGVLEQSSALRGAGHAWHQTHLFDREPDYDLFKSYLEDLEYEENFEAVKAREREGGGDFVMRGNIGFSPMHSLIYDYMGIQRFSFEWFENRSAVLELYEILREKFRALCRLAARAPQRLINICGNVTATVISPQMFDEYYLPVYDEAAEILQAAGKLVGVHFDGITGPYGAALGRSRLDFIDALTPPPTCDLTVTRAHELWPDKALWFNFPSAVHMRPDDEVRRVARQILAESRAHKRFLLGITEDVPKDRWPVTLRIILDEVNRHVLD